MSVEAVNSVQNVAKPIQNEKITQPQKTEEKQDMTNGTKLLLGSLAALAIGGVIYALTRGKGGKGVTNSTKNNPVTSEAPSEIKILKEKIQALRKTIRENYNNEKQKINEKVSLIPNDEKYLGSGIKSASDFDKLIRHLKEDKIEDKECLEEMTNFVRNYRRKLIERVRALNQDPDWQLLRKFRCINKHKYFDQDIRTVYDHLLDNLLYAKANNTTSEFLEILGLSVEDAMQMVKEPRGAQERINSIVNSIIGKHTPENALEYSTKLKALMEKRTKFGDTIPIEDLFIDLSDEAKKVKDILPKLKNRLEHIRDLEQKKEAYKLEIKDYTDKFRQSLEVKELKEALQKLSELESVSSEIT